MDTMAIPTQHDTLRDLLTQSLFGHGVQSRSNCEVLPKEVMKVQSGWMITKATRGTSMIQLVRIYPSPALDIIGAVVGMTPTSLRTVQTRTFTTRRTRRI